jgi:hypothetical protein
VLVYASAMLVPRQWFEAFTAAGGRGELVMLRPVG